MAFNKITFQQAVQIDKCYRKSYRQRNPGTEFPREIVYKNQYWDMIVFSSWKQSYFPWFPGQQDPTWQTSQVLLVWIKNKSNIWKSIKHKESARVCRTISIWHLSLFAKCLTWSLQLNKISVYCSMQSLTWSYFKRRQLSISPNEDTICFQQICFIENSRNNWAEQQNKLQLEAECPLALEQHM